MIIYCFSDGDDSVGVPGGEIVVDIKNRPERFFAKDELEYLLKIAKEFAEDCLADDVEVYSESQWEKYLEDENKWMGIEKELMK